MATFRSADSGGFFKDDGKRMILVLNACFIRQVLEFWTRISSDGSGDLYFFHQV
jgi:hypothetical protein